MAKGGIRNCEETPAEARRRRLAESLRANLRRRKERDRQRAGSAWSEEANGPPEGEADCGTGGETD